MEDENFNVDLFIDEIEKRPAIWDMNSKDFSNKIIKKSWEELILIFSGNESSNVKKKYLDSTPGRSCAMTLCSPDPVKARLREEVSERLAAYSADEKKAQSTILFEKLIKHDRYVSASRIALYLSTEREVDTAAILQHAWGCGKTVFLPQYAGGHMHMIKMVAQDDKGSALDTKENALETGGLDLVITPGVAFSSSGGRLGHGGGYYDRFLRRARSAGAPPYALALAFSCQLRPDADIPMTAGDQPVDEVITAY